MDSIKTIKSNFDIIKENENEQILKILKDLYLEKYKFNLNERELYILNNIINKNNFFINKNFKSIHFYGHKFDFSIFLNCYIEKCIFSSNYVFIISSVLKNSNFQNYSIIINSKINYCNFYSNKKIIDSIF